MLKPFLVAAAVGLTATAAAAQPPAAQPPVRQPVPPATKPLTRDGGQPVGNNQNTRIAGENGPALLDNLHLLEKMARFDRERIPERVVHARGVGAHGEFVTAADLSKYTKAKLFAEKGKKTDVFMRFSPVVHPRGSPENLRDPRGFAVKFYTDDGNWDLVGNNLPVFFIRDAMKFPDLVHAFKPSPITNQQDPNRVFDFFSHIPECTHMMTFLYSDQGTPSNLRQMDGFGVHAFKLVNAAGDVTYVKFNWRSKQGLKPGTADETAAAAAKNHSFHTADLYDAISAKRFPSWDLRVQLLAPADLPKFDFDPLDVTKVWTGVPEVTVGTMTLNRVPSNFFQFTEQVAFSPAVVVPGIEPSEDKLLQGRLFSYADTQRYRVGTNYLMLPVNRPKVGVTNDNQDGKMNFGVTATDVNYEPSVTDPKKEDPKSESSKLPLAGLVVQQPIKKTLNFQQAGELYRSFDDAAKANLIKNLAGDLGKVKNEAVKRTMVSFFYRADVDYGTKLAAAVKVDPDDVKKLVETK